MVGVLAGKRGKQVIVTQQVQLIGGCGAGRVAIMTKCSLCCIFFIYVVKKQTKTTFLPNFTIFRIVDSRKSRKYRLM